MKKAFTLIELLVVVLIIGILAAVAVPQYQKVVRKSRFMQVWTNVRALAIAQQQYFLANGRYSSQKSELDITLTDREDGSCSVSSSRNTVACWIYKPYVIMYYLGESNRYDCCAYDADNDQEEGDKLCQSIGGKSYYEACSVDSSCHCWKIK